MAATPHTVRPFTGWHMTAIMIAFFAVVFAVNFGMARLASSTFSGVVVHNSYDASQSFNRWLSEAAREKTLAWDAYAGRTADGRVLIRIARDGATPVPAGAVLTGEARRPLGLPEDKLLAFSRKADGTWVSTMALQPGRWKLRVRLEGSDAAGRTIVWRDEASI
jgi:nitrogen fixation protein FixH